MHPCSFFHQNKVESSFCCLRKLRSAKSWTLSYACGYLSVCQSFSGFRAWLNVNFFPVVFPFWCFFLILHWLTGKKQICDDRHTKKARQIHTDAHWQACRREMETKQYSIKIWKYLNSTKSSRSTPWWRQTAATAPKVPSSSPSRGHRSTETPSPWRPSDRDAHTP